MRVDGCFFFFVLVSAFHLLFDRQFRNTCFGYGLSSNKNTRFSSVRVLFICCWTANEICICERKVFHRSEFFFSSVFCALSVVWLFSSSKSSGLSKCTSNLYALFIFSLMHDWNLFVADWLILFSFHSKANKTIRKTFKPIH